MEKTKCLLTDDKYEYWGYWIICKCGFNNVECSEYCAGCGKLIEIDGKTEEEVHWI